MLQSNPDITSSMVRNYVIVLCTDLFCYSQKSKKMLLLLSLKCFFYISDMLIQAHFLAKQHLGECSSFVVMDKEKVPRLY